MISCSTSVRLLLYMSSFGLSTILATRVGLSAAQALKVNNLKCRNIATESVLEWSSTCGKCYAGHPERAAWDCVSRFLLDLTLVLYADLVNLQQRFQADKQKVAEMKAARRFLTWTKSSWIADRHSDWNLQAVLGERFCHVHPSLVWCCEWSSVFIHCILYAHLSSFLLRKAQCTIF